MPDIFRLQKDLSEIQRMYNVKVIIPDEDDITTFIVKLKVQDGLYRDTWFRFKFVITKNWPNCPPDVKILDKIWHPNIELVQDGNPNTGRVCVSTLKDTTYIGSMRLEEIVISLKFLLNNLNPRNALNVEAANEQTHNYDSFKSKVDSLIDDMKADDNYTDDDD